MAKYKSLFSKGEVVETFGGGLMDKFGLPPFSVFDARQGEWQSRKAAWLSLGIKSELGRGGNLLKYSDTILEPDPKKRAKKKQDQDALFNTQNLLNDMMKQKKRLVVNGYDVTDQMPLTVAELEKQRPKGKQKATTFDSGGPGTLGKQFAAIPGGGTGKNSAWKYKTASGYKTEGEIQKETASLKGGLMFRTTNDPYHNEGGDTSMNTGTSIFDPVLCEMFYRWFVPKRGMICDPFAGGSVRGVVASRLDYQYTGFELRKEQVDANRAQAKELCKPSRAAWINDDSRNIRKHLGKESVDAIFSCPPYADLEVYSDDPKDLSTLEYDDFIEAYAEIIKICYTTLRPNRFACFVVGEVRDKNGNLRGFVPDTVSCFEQAGFRLYNDAILLTAVGSLSIRVGKQFTVTRKLGRTHQYCLIFLKGDPRKAAEATGALK